MRRTDVALSIHFLLIPHLAAAAPGTEFWAAHSRSSGANASFSIVVGNPGLTSADITIDDSVGGVASGTVPAGASREFNLGKGIGVMLTDRQSVAYRVRSTVPVHAYQFLDYADTTGTTSASILQDRSTYGRDFMVLAARADIGSNRPSVVTVIAPDPVRVRITASSATQAGATIPALAAGETGEFDLAPFEVLQLGSLANGDLTGTVLHSDKPIEVFAGCTSCVLGWWSGADEVQELMLPLPAWGTVIPAPSTEPGTSQPDLWRIVAAEDATVVTTDPPQSGTPCSLDRGMLWEATLSGDFVIQASKPVLAGRYTGCPGIAADCDPSMALLLPAERFTVGAVFGLTTVLPDFARGWVDIVAPAGATVTVDSTPVPSASFVRIGASTFYHAQVPLDMHTETHSVQSDVPIAVYVTHDSDAASVSSFPADIDLPANLAPDCDAGGPYLIACAGPTTSVVISGAGSRDPEGAPLAYQWSSSSPAIAFSNSTTAAPLVTVTGLGAFPIDLVVTDGFNTVACSTTIEFTGDTIVPSELSRATAPLWQVKAGTDIRYSFEDRGPAPLSYNLYEGSLRPLDSHLPLACNLAGAIATPGRRETLLTPGTGSRYYLVTAGNCAAEGPSGHTSTLDTCPP